MFFQRRQTDTDNKREPEQQRNKKNELWKKKSAPSAFLLF